MSHFAVRPISFALTLILLPLHWLSVVAAAQSFTDQQRAEEEQNGYKVIELNSNAKDPTVYYFRDDQHDMAWDVFESTKKLMSVNGGFPPGYNIQPPAVTAGGRARGLEIRSREVERKIETIRPVTPPPAAPIRPPSRPYETYKNPLNKPATGKQQKLNVTAPPPIKRPASTPSVGSRIPKPEGQEFNNDRPKEAPAPLPASRSPDKPKAEAAKPGLDRFGYDESRPKSPAKPAVKPKGTSTDVNRQLANASRAVAEGVKQYNADMAAWTKARDKVIAEMNAVDSEGASFNQLTNAQRTPDRLARLNARKEKSEAAGRQILARKADLAARLKTLETRAKNLDGVILSR